MHQTETEALLRGVSLRVTRPRVAVLEAVQAHPHSDTGTVVQVVRGQLGAVSTQAVYDGLRALTDAGLLRRIEPEGSTARYERRVGDNHHHMICRGCGTISDVDCATGSAPCLEGAQGHGFTVDEVEVTYWGLCPACQKA